MAGCTKAERNCDGKMCTMEFRTISVKLTDAAGSPVALDDFKVVRMPGGEDVTRAYVAQEWSMFRQFGSYPVASDADDQRFPKDSNTSLIFFGYIDGREVVTSPYVITFDCCHIQLVSGERELVVD